MSFGPGLQPVSQGQGPAGFSPHTSCPEKKHTNSAKDSGVKSQLGPDLRVSRIWPIVHGCLRTPGAVALGVEGDKGLGEAPHGNAKGPLNSPMGSMPPSFC